MNMYLKRKGCEIMNKVCIYLRKSRADEELEKTLGEGETLSKHRKALLKFAKENNLNITEIKEEIVSGDSLFHRPKMLELLKEIGNKEYTGVLVMDIDRLGRGGMKDQGIILDTFKESNTKIITPLKTYDLNDEMDEEMTEFKTFFSRRELKTINRRMQGGRIRSIEDGNYIATNAPLGYDIDYIKKSRTLKINLHESEIIKLLFKLYTEGDGAGSIASYLNSLGYKTKTNSSFTSSSIIAILKNPIYVGKVTWKKREYKKSMNPNKVKDCRTRDKSEWIIVDGKHPAIIEESIFNRANEILREKYHIPYRVANPPANPLAGLIVCGVCENKMVMRKYRGVKRILCTHKCGNRGIRFDYFEKELLDSLDKYLNNYKFSIKDDENNNDKYMYSKQLTLLNKEYNTLGKQKLKLFDLFETEVYSQETFLERSKNIDERIEHVKSEIARINHLMNKEDKRINATDIVYVEKIVKAYKDSNDIKLKNELLKNIILKIEYFKKPEQRNDEFTIKLYPKLLR